MFVAPYAAREADDLVQEIMAKAFLSLSTYNPRYAFSTWLYTIARNHCINHVKKRRISAISEADPDQMAAAAEAQPDALLQARETEAVIAGVLDSLQPAYAQMAYLRFHEECSYQEISRICQVPTGSVKSRIHLIRKQIKDKLESL